MTKGFKRTEDVINRVQLLQKDWTFRFTVTKSNVDRWIDRGLCTESVKTSIKNILETTPVSVILYGANKRFYLEVIGKQKNFFTDIVITEDDAYSLVELIMYGV